MSEEPVSYNRLPEGEESELDLMALARTIWQGRRTVFISVGICAVLGVFIALFSPKKYTVSTVIVPQISSSSNSSLTSLASLAGFDLGGAKSTAELSPILYPQIVNSVPFQLELMNTPLRFEECDTAVSLFTYYTDIKKPSVIGVVKKYTIGIPFLLLDIIRGDKPEPDYSGSGDGTPLPMSLTKDQEEMSKSLDEMVSLVTNSKEGYLTLTVSGPEALATAQLAQRAQQLLQQEIIKFKVEKSQAELDFVQGRYDEVKRETEALQAQVARFTDRSKDLINTYSQLEQTRIQNKYNISNSVYQELAKQLEQAKLQVKKDTPAFSVLKPVVIPIERSAPKRAQILAIWLFLGCIIGGGLVLLKQYLPEWKQKWNDTEKETN